MADYDDETAYMIINDIYDSIVLRDVVERYKIRNVELFNRIMRYIMDNVGVRHIYLYDFLTVIPL